MTVSRCLLPFARQFEPDRAVMAERWRELPKQCPHPDCTATSCRSICGDWAAMQFRIVNARELRPSIKVAA